MNLAQPAHDLHAARRLSRHVKGGLHRAANHGNIGAPFDFAEGRERGANLAGDGSLVFDAMLSIAAGITPEERDAFIDSTCPPGMRERIRQSLAAGVPPATPSPAGAHGVLPFETIDEFRLLSRLGAGGMGEVFLARDSTLCRYVALKTIASWLARNEDDVERFRREAVNVAQLRHPAIVPVHKVEASGPRPYLVMDYIPGATLRDEITALRDLGPAERKQRLMSESRVRRMADTCARVADALHYTHDNGIVHRDVKPTNILVDPSGSAFLTDFGVAKNAENPGTTMSGQVTGTVAYMSPEQVNSGEIDRRTDVFALGVVLYECLTTELPFLGETIAETWRRIVDVPPAPVRRLNPGVPRDLAVICHKALEKDPIRRYQTAAHLAGDLRCFLEGRLISGRPPSPARRVVLWGRTHRIQAMAATLALLAGSVVALGGLELQRRNAHTTHLEVAVSAMNSAPTLHIQATDPRTALLGPTRVATLPFEGRVAPGHYRLTVADGDRVLAERSVVALAGAALSLRLPTSLPTPDTGNMLLVEASPCRVGHPDASESLSERTITLPAFWIDRAEVANADYREFVDATGRDVPLPWTLSEFDHDALADRPVVGISWADAQAYAQWRGKRLPTHLEWECAMRGAEGWLQPWGPATADLPLVTLRDAALTHAERLETAFEEYRKHTLSVTARPDLGTPTGLFHGATNVSEFTDSVLFGVTSQVVFKGASWTDVPEVFDLSRVRTLPLLVTDGDVSVYPRSIKIGFRCARSAMAP